MSETLRTPVSLPDDPEPFIGREREIRELGAYLSAGQGPRPRVLALVGASGVGKSALAARLARDAGALSGLPVCWIPALPHRLTADPDVPHLRMLSQLGARRRDLFRSPVASQSTGIWRDDSYTELVNLPRLVHFSVSGGVVVVFDDVSGCYEANRLLWGFEGTSAVVIFTSDSSEWKDRLGASDSEARIHQVQPLHDPYATTLLRALGAAGVDISVPAARSLPLFLRIAAADPAPDTAAQPWELVDRARKRLGPEPEGMLLRLARADLREFDEETIRTVLLFPPPGEQLAELVASLCASGLMQRVRAGRFQVHPGVRALLPPPRQLPIRWRALHDAAHSRVRAALHGTGRPLSGETIEDWLELIQQMIRVPSVGSVHLAGTLARYLAEQNDPHRLFALRAIVANHVLPETESSIVVPIAMAARRVGQLDQAEHLLRTANRREAAPELALVLRDSGRLLEAIAVLDEEHAERASVEEDPPALLARGAVRCDQGWHEEAERALSQAASRLAGRAARRDMAWARLEQGRCELLLGHLQSAENLIDAARETFRMLADERGVAWATTEYGRLHLLLGPDDALALLNEAEAMHRATEDARGMDWTDLCQELALNEPVSPDPPGWHWPMRKNPDRLLRAWRLHFAVARPDAQPDRLSLEATSLFKAMGCPRGQAWSLLTEGLTNLATGSDDWIAQALEQCAEAERLFQTIGDGTAKGWQQYVRLRHRIPQRLQDVLTPDRPALKLPPWWSQPSISEDSPYTLPLLARLTILPVTAADSASDETAESDDACRVRLTLLDDSPTVQAAARILLQVEPGARHPWADLAKAPYLSAVALPLTRGTLVPHTALLRASTQAEHGAQFLFRSERPGRHRMRFTIVDDASGTVLQQVETEVDLTPAPPARTVLSPFPHRSER